MPRTITPLTDQECKAVRYNPDGGNKLFDGDGLFLATTSTGSKLWRFKYRFQGKEKLISLGAYPEVSLKAARELRAEHRRLVAASIDPSQHRQDTKHQREGQAKNTLEIVGREWLSKRKSTWAITNYDRVVSSLEQDVFPWLGSQPLTTITAPEILSVLRRIEKRGAIDTAHRVKQRIGQIFRYGIATGRAERDPTHDLLGALPPVRQQHFATVTEPKRIGEILQVIDGYKGTLVVNCALRLAPLVFVRPGNLRAAEWTEFNLALAEWRIPAEKMKNGEPHIVPLSKQALDILLEIKPLTGDGLFVFPSARSNKRPMSDNAILAAMRTLGIPKEEMTGHGFRHMASTVMHELGWSSEVIERQLAHTERNKVKATYNHAKYLPERRVLMQAWADHLDGLKAATTSGY